MASRTGRGSGDNGISNNPIVVGIDGSKAAVTAAQWAVAEAVSRGAPLRLVAVIDVPDPGASKPDDISLELQYAETELRAAEAAVQAVAKRVKVDTGVRCGDIDKILLEESRSASMACVGTVGVGPVASRLLGSTAVAVATGAYCPVAVIRTDREPQRGEWIVVVVDHRAGGDDVVGQAFEEARVRKAPLLALGVWRWDLGAMRYDELDQRLRDWLPRFPDVEVTLCASRGGPVEYLGTHDESVQLLVTGPVDALQLRRLIGPHARPILGHPECSVLVVPH